MSSRIDINPLLVEKIHEICDDKRMKNLIKNFLELEIQWIEWSQNGEKEFKNEFPKLIDTYFKYEEDTNEGK